MPALAFRRMELRSVKHAFQGGEVISILIGSFAVLFEKHKERLNEKKEPPAKSVWTIECRGFKIDASCPIVQT